MPFGAEIQDDGNVRFALWAPAAHEVEVGILTEDDRRFVTMQRQANGWFKAVTAAAAVGAQYRFRLDGDIEVPDPASRYQPRDVHGPSEVIDPGRFRWHDADWQGRPWEDAVLYELHLGCFTPAGTLKAAQDKLDYLVDLGITAVELMPVADFPGARGWGYDGVDLYAVESRYGHPDDLKAFVEAAHLRGLMVFLDVVYNHFGPEGNYLYRYAPDFFTDRHHTPWGNAINFDGDTSHWVREFFIHNALFWLEEYHLDGLRLDAVHAILDDSEPDILTELAQRVQAGPGTHRQVHLVLENDDNAAHYLLSSDRSGQAGYRAQWNDDIHHTLHVLLTGESQGYYKDYAGNALAMLQRCLTAGFAYQGETSAFRGGQPRGEPSGDLPATAFVGFLQNHDQIGNRAFGERLTRLTDTQRLQAATALLLLQPAPPLLFMGQEWGCTQPFQYFCDLEDALAEAVVNGRRDEFAGFPEFREPTARARIPDPLASTTFERSRLDWSALTQPSHEGWLTLHKTLLELRQRMIRPLLDNGPAQRADAKRLGDAALLVTWELGDAFLTLAFNLGDEPVVIPGSPAGRLHYTTHPDIITKDRHTRLPSASLACFLDCGRMSR